MELYPVSKYYCFRHYFSKDETMRVLIPIVKGVFIRREEHHGLPHSVHLPPLTDTKVDWTSREWTLRDGPSHKQTPHFKPTLKRDVPHVDEVISFFITKVNSKLFIHLFFLFFWSCQRSIYRCSEILKLAFRAFPFVRELWSDQGLPFKTNMFTNQVQQLTDHYQLQTNKA